MKADPGRPGADHAGDAPATVGESERWLVLVVDDAPDVHELTRLMLARTCYAGRMLDIHSAYTAAEAARFLRAHPQTAVVVLDVVMETDDAGLGLVRHVREALGNHNVQILLRTGHPCAAPEERVTVDYDINGYFLKTELTAQRLQSIVTFALRSFQSMTRGDSLETSPRKIEPPSEPLRRVDPAHVELLAQPQFSLATGALVGLALTPCWPSKGGMVTFEEALASAPDPEDAEAFDRVIFEKVIAWVRVLCSLPRGPLTLSFALLSAGSPEVLCGLWDALAPGPQRYGDRLLDLRLPGVLMRRDSGDEFECYRWLRARGVSLTLADVGSVPLFLPRIQSLRLARISIHRGFVRDVMADPEKIAIARTVIALAHTLGVTVIADGITSEADAQFFKWEGCDLGQGEFLGPELPLAQAISALAGMTPH